MVNRILQVMLAAVVEQLHPRMEECSATNVLRKSSPLNSHVGDRQSVTPVQSGWHRRSVTTLMAEQRQHRRNAQFQQREKVM